mgnify:CR=1 FL=1
MATQSLSYDHPQYTVHGCFAGNLTGVSKAVRFCAFTNMIIKNYNLTPAIAGTSASQIYTAYKLTGTTTTTQILTTYGSAGTAGTSVAGTFTLAQGDVLSITKGTDATDEMAVGIEYAVVPGASTTR